MNYTPTTNLPPNRGNWFLTYSGVQFFLEHPAIEDLRAVDMVHALSRQCRYAGHLPYFYSVAQHSVIASQKISKGLAKEALFHDAAETYVQDMIRPLKKMAGMEKYAEVEEKVERLIAQYFGLQYPWPGEVKFHDDRMVMTERRDLYHPEALKNYDWGFRVQPYEEVIKPLSFSDAKDLFEYRFVELMGMYPYEYDQKMHGWAKPDVIKR